MLSSVSPIVGNLITPARLCCGMSRKSSMTKTNKRMKTWHSRNPNTQTFGRPNGLACCKPMRLVVGTPTALVLALAGLTPLCDYHASETKSCAFYCCRTVECRATDHIGRIPGCVEPVVRLNESTQVLCKGHTGTVCCRHLYSYMAYRLPRLLLAPQMVQASGN